MSTPTETIYARVRADLNIGARLRKLREDHGWPKPSIGRLVELLLDQALTLNEPKPAKKAPAKKARKR